MESQSLSCPECGASRINGLDCFGQLGQIIVWEYDDPELLAKHFLTLASYNLQHPARFTEVTIQELKTVFIDHLDKGLAIKEIRRKLSKKFAGAIPILQAKAQPNSYSHPWTLTINTVYLPDKPEGAANRVRVWAKSIRQCL